jgi:hypothetical protein
MSHLTSTSSSTAILNGNRDKTPNTFTGRNEQEKLHEKNEHSPYFTLRWLITGSLN